MASIKDLLSPMEDADISAGVPSQPTAQRNSVTPPTLRYNIEFVLDTICPHCYIGLRNLNAAIDMFKKRYPQAIFEVTCSPIVLTPSAGRSVDLKGNYYRHIRGFAASTLDDWSRQGAAAGIKFDWEGGLTGNSRDSHKLLRLALEATPTTYRSSSFTQTFGHDRSSAAPSSSFQQQQTSSPSGRPGARGPQTQMELITTIYREYFENNHDISDRSWLLRIGTSLTNIPPAEIKACLESEEWDRAIDRLSERNKQEFNAVPVFIIQGRFVAGGWQSSERFMDIFERLRVEGPNAPGRTLSVPGGGWWMPGGVFQVANQQP